MSEVGLRDKVVVITGSSRGWGRGMAHLFASYGACVVVNGRTQSDVEAVANEIVAAGGRAIPVTTSVTADGGPDLLVNSALQEYGRIDVLVNNAGRLQPNLLQDMTDEDWDAILDLQLRAPFRCARAAARAMIAAGTRGQIINVAGAAAVRGMYANSNHAASKAGILACTWTWALELLELGIRVNAVRGSVHTEVTSDILGFDATPSATDESSPLLSPTDASVLIAWLATDAAANINGQFIGIDRGVLTVWGRAEEKLTVALDGPLTVERFAAEITPVVERVSTISWGVAEVVPVYSDLHPVISAGLKTMRQS